MYAMGVTDVDTMLMILGVSVDMEPQAMDYVTKELIRGFNGKNYDSLNNINRSSSCCCNECNRWTDCS